MALAHACIAVLLHPLSSRGETGEKDDDDERETPAGNGRRGRRRRQGCRRRRGQSNGNFFLARLPTPCVLLLPCTSASFFPGTALRPLSFLYSTLYENRGARIPLERCITVIRAKGASF
ncbi:hypothetical protein PUN28_006447 [Cardiocondyla obscurior]|uniref:Secreted protein n=1 Tax=Cardiocondyla obscurior TaxID=286306 RepID=A0AAW2GAM5_9HYME